MGVDTTAYPKGTRKDWTKDEVDFLKNHYVIYGPQFCAERLRRSVKSIYYKVHRIGVKIRGWSDEDLEFLKDNFYRFGPSRCARMLDKKKVTVQATARKLGL